MSPFPGWGSEMFAVLGVASATALGLALTTAVAAVSKWAPNLRVGVRMMVAACAAGTAATALVGVFGWRWSASRIDEALSAVDPDTRSELRRLGAEEAADPLWFGIGCATVLGVGTLAVASFARLGEER